MFLPLLPLRIGTFLLAGTIAMFGPHPRLENYNVNLAARSAHQGHQDDDYFMGSDDEVVVGRDGAPFPSDCWGSPLQ